MWVSHDIQTIYPHPFIKYFPVSTMVASIDSRQIHGLIQQSLTDASLEDQEEIRRQNNIISEKTSERITPWINRAGWLTTLAGKDMSELYRLTDSGIEVEEKGYEGMQRAVLSLVQKCLDGIKDIENRGWSILRFWLNSTKINEADQKPFQLYYNDGTIKRYSTHWLRLILFTLRSSDPGRNGIGIRYTMAQKEALRALSEPSQREDGTGRDLEGKLLQLSRTLIDQHDFSTGSPSVIKYFCSIMAWDPATKRWRRPGTYTPFLAAIQFCIRVLTCEIILPMAKRSDYYDGDMSDETPLGVLQRYRQKWLVDGAPYPFNWVHSLMVYGIHVAADDKTEDKIRFSNDDKLLYWQGRELEIAAWRQFPGDILRGAEKILSRELLFQEDDNVESINPYDIIDNQGCRDNQYFFANHIPEYRDTARKKLIGNLDGRVERMVTIKDMQIRWNDAAIDQYVVAQNRFLEHLLIAFNLVGGLTGRGTEMLSVLYRNTPETDRHMLIQDGQLIVATQYHKSQNVMDALKVCLIYFID
jgi:hypothetical protein